MMMMQHFLLFVCASQSLTRPLGTIVLSASIGVRAQIGLSSPFCCRHVLPKGRVHNVVLDLVLQFRLETSHAQRVLCRSLPLPYSLSCYCYATCASGWLKRVAVASLSRPCPNQQKKKRNSNNINVGK